MKATIDHSIPIPPLRHSGVGLLSGWAATGIGRLAVALVVIFSVPPPLPAKASQVFLLDFDTLQGDGFHHNYTSEERDVVVAGMNKHLLRLGMTATREVPGPGVFFSTVFFNSLAAGTSDGIDFRNVSKTDNARLNIKAMLAFVGIDEADMDSAKIVRASINVGLHEALHLLGARHQDAYTLPGFGMPTGGIADRYTPPYPGPRGASHTRNTFMGLTTGLFGLTEEKLLDDDLFISPRTAMKAVLSEVPQLVMEQTAPNNHPTLAQPVTTRRFTVANTLPEDIELPEGFELPPGVGPADLELFAEAVVITGTITPAEEDHPTHYCVVPVVPGHPYTIEAVSAVLDQERGERGAITKLHRSPRSSMTASRSEAAQAPPSFLKISLGIRFPLSFVDRSNHSHSGSRAAVANLWIIRNTQEY